MRIARAFILCSCLAMLYAYVRNYSSGSSYTCSGNGKQVTCVVHEVMNKECCGKVTETYAECHIGIWWFMSDESPRILFSPLKPRFPSIPYVEVMGLPSLLACVHLSMGPLVRYFNRACVWWLVALRGMIRRWCVGAGGPARRALATAHRWIMDRFTHE